MDWQTGPANPSYGMTPTIDLSSASFTDYIWRPTTRLYIFLMVGVIQKKNSGGLARQAFFWYENDKDLFAAHASYRDVREHFIYRNVLPDRMAELNQLCPAA